MAKTVFGIAGFKPSDREKNVLAVASPENIKICLNMGLLRKKKTKD